MINCPACGAIAAEKHRRGCPRTATAERFDIVAYMRRRHEEIAHEWSEAVHAQMDKMIEDGWGIPEHLRAENK